VPCPVERRAQAADDQAAHQPGIAEADFGFGRVDVDVDFAGRHVEEQGDDSVAVAREHVGISAANSTDQDAVFDGAPVHEEILVVGNAAVEGRESGNATQHYSLAVKFDRDAVFDERPIGERRDARRLAFVLDRQRPPSVMFDRESDLGPRHREAFHDIDAGRIFAARGAEEFATRGDILKEPFDKDTRARRIGMRAFADHDAVIDLALPALAARNAAFDRHTRHTGDRRQCLTAKAHRRHRFDRVGRQFRCGVAFERQADLVRRHAATIVTNVNHIGATRGQTDIYPPCAGVDCVFDQFFQRSGWTFDNFARCDAIYEVFGQATY
jgi:hypothetical protein